MRLDLDRLGALVAEAAAEEILPRFRNLGADDTVDKTSPQDLVTVADRAMEARLSSLLRAAWPGAAIVGEEAVFEAPALLDHIAEAELCFILDPIDGTWNFAHGLPLFGVIVAVTAKGRTIGGLIADPLGGDHVCAERGGGAWRSGPRGAARLNVAKAAAIEDMSGYAATGLFDRATRARLAPLLTDFARVQSLRASAWEYRTLAEGAVHFALNAKLNAWDHAAGHLIHAEAGGHGALTDGRTYAPALSEGRLLLAPDPDSWHALRDRFAPALTA